MMPKISIIIPVYNVEKYLPECLDSVISQTLRDIEIVCINDGSPDNSLSILKDYAAKDKRIVLIDKQNEGVGKARNDGMRVATGEFIAFMDSDDYYPASDVLEKLYTEAKMNGVLIAGGRRIRLLSDASIERQEKEFSDHTISFSLSTGIHTYADYQYDYGYTQFIYQRNLLNDNHIVFPSYKRFQDPPFYVNAMIAGQKFFVCDIESYCYRRIGSEERYTLSKTLDFLHGLQNNLMQSKQHNLCKLHFLTALRLNKDASFMAIKNIQDPNFSALLSEFIKTIGLVDVDWLKSNGFCLPEPYNTDLIMYLLDNTVKYEKIRNNKAVKAASKLLKR